MVALVSEFTEKFAQAIKEKAAFENWSDTRILETTAGAKYDRILWSDSYGTDYRPSRSVYAFVERSTGALLKAEGWKRPAKGVRFDLASTEGFTAAVEAADQYGSFLYIR